MLPDDPNSVLPPMPQITTIPSLSSVPTPAQTSEPVQKPKKTFPKLILFLVPLVLILLVSVVSVSAYLVATEVIPMSNLPLKASITSTVYSLPFIPKTPKIVLDSATKAHEKLQKNSFDLSIASNSNSFQSILGGSNLDLQVKGYLDYTRQSEPHFSLTAVLNKDLSLQANKPGPKVYLKINEIPFFLSAMLGTDSARLKPVLENWVAIDATPMKTDARDLVNQKSPSGSQLNEATLKIISQITEDSVLPLLKMSTENMDGITSYKITYHPTPQQLDVLAENIRKQMYPDSPSTTKTKISDYVKDFQLVMWIRQKDYFISQVNLTISYYPGQLSNLSPLSMGTLLDSSPVSIAVVLKLSEFGNQKSISTPEFSITPEEFYRLLMADSPFLNLPAPIPSTNR